MSKKNKLVRRVRTNQKNVRFDDLCRLLREKGFEERPSQHGGSHRVFVHSKTRTIVTIPYPHKGQFVLPVYVRNVVKALESLGLLQGEEADGLS
jgi:predicted RNA binding protein YcfA (HicA-like mRNA interferase family)